MDERIKHEEGWRAGIQSGLAWTDPNEARKKTLVVRELTEIGGPAGLKGIDFGCGDAYYTAFLSGLGCEMVGCDISEAILADNKLRHPDLEFIKISGNETLPVGDASFDFVYASEVIEHLYDPDEAFAQFASALRRGGRLIITTPFHARFKNVLISLFFFERHFDVRGQHIRFWTRKSLKDMCLRHGLQPIRWTSVGRRWPVPMSFFLVAERV